MNAIRRIQSACLSLGALLLLAAPAVAGSETPPEGPDWERSLVEARKQAMARNVPIFVYFTKTY